MRNNTTISYSDLEKEIRKSEYQRTRMMMGAFIAGFVIAILNYFMLSEKSLQYYGGTLNYFIVVFWLGLFIVYEFFVSRLIRRFMRTKSRISNTFKLMHSFVEVSMTSLLIFYMANVKHLHNSLDSPITLVYYLFLILSVLHLERKISFLTGVFAAIQYFLISYCSFHLSHGDQNFIFHTPENNYYMRCVVLVVSGAAAGYVAAEVRRRLNATLDVKKAKKEMESLFRQQVSPEVLQALVKDRGGLTKIEATVLVMDIRNFTKFAERHSPDEIMDFQNKIFGPIIDIIDQHDGVVNQIMGDGLMATFGTPVHNHRHADMAFQAALKIREKVKELSLEAVIPHTQIGLGLHTGEVVTGNIGNETRKQYSISGSAVIIAFRLEQLNKEFGSELLITGEVRGRIARDKSTLSYLGLKPIKGFEFEVDVYQAA